MKTFTATIASSDHYILGESPLWDADRKRVLWVDAHAGSVFEGELVDRQIVTTRKHDFEDTSSAVAFDSAGNLLVANHRSVIALDADGQRREVASLIPAGQQSRLNDAACDPAGRFIVGSMTLDIELGKESLWRIETDGSVTLLDEGLTLSNGLSWSPDGSLLYSTDTIAGTIWAWDYDVATGEVGPKRVHIALQNEAPDGHCCDSQGNLWVAVWGPVRSVASHRPASRSQWWRSMRR